MIEMFGTPGAVVIVVGTFLALWLLCFWLVAQLGGWASLAETFATDRPPAGETFQWTSGKCNFISTYNNCLTVSVMKDGVRIRPMLLFRFAHKTLFIPWDAVAVMGLRRELFRYGTAMEITKPTGVHPLTLYGQPLAESLARHAPDRLLRPPPGYED